ncbi:tyrosine-type recombinase/integrase [Ochrobactrum intermedium]|uniref:tyrosine-type recombinase/integrase n=1 Tax=Brucella intermedia TaxID=94625 RepID=UPI00159BF71B|nr:tyrosine-type recombinase/integrase [Brucella intermedia]NVM43001.1 tyrosine-type recombinase/integrase [Brucella intermedia]
MRDMPRPRKPYTQKEITRHGKTVWYFRRGKEKRIRLPGAFGSQEFNDAYNAALAGQPVERQASAPKSSLRWLVDRYYESGRFLRLADGTQRKYRGILESVCKTGGTLNFRSISKKDIIAGRVRREAKPFAAQAYVISMKLLFEFAVDSGWIDNNPAVGAAAPLQKTDGYHTWTEDEVLRFQSYHPLGTQARLALDIMLYTGLRISDAIRIGPQHIKDGMISVKTKKTGTDIFIPVLPPLTESIASAKISGLLFLPSPKGKQRQDNAASVWFKRQAELASVPGTAHGLRKAGATFAAENGATPHELAAMYGWSSTQMAEHYTRKANRTKLAKQAANKLYPHLEKSAGVETKK